MVTIGVVSDTHIPGRAAQLPEAMLSAFGEVDLILHAGDLTSLEVMEALEELAPVEAVQGNMDDLKVRARLAERRIVEAEGCRIGLVHGSGSPLGLERRALRAFEANGVQAVVFGHSHKPFNHRVGEVLLFNPGSPTDRRFSPHGSFGRLRVNGRAVSGEVVEITAPG